MTGNSFYHRDAKKKNTELADRDEWSWLLLKKLKIYYPPWRQRYDYNILFNVYIQMYEIIHILVLGDYKFIGLVIGI